MKKILLLITLYLSVIKIMAQSYEQLYIQQEQSRITNVNKTEIEIENFINQNLDSFDFSSTINKVNQIKGEDGQMLSGAAYSGALISAKKEKLRNYYFQKNPEKIQLYYANTLQQCVNGGFEDNGGSTSGYSFASNKIPYPAWSLFNNNPTNGITPGVGQKATLVDNSISDPFVGIPRVNTGTHSIRLGNSNFVDQEQDFYHVTKMTRTFVVNESSISFAFALVLDDGGLTHVNANTNPYYQVKLFDNNNQAVFTRNVMANSSNPLFQQSNNGVLYTNWLCERISTARFMGQTVRLEIILSDCGAGGHWGYGYFDDFCGFDCTTPSFNPGITLNSIKEGCPKFPLPVTGNITLPTNASFTNVTLQILDTSNNIVSSQIITSAIGGAFSTNLNYSNFYPSGYNSSTEFNIRAILNYSIGGMTQNPIVINNTNPPGPDISFQECYTPCFENIIIGENQPITISSNFQVFGNIVSSAYILPNLNVNFRSGYQIQLLPGFHTTGNQTGIFHAYIAPCEENINSVSKQFSKDIGRLIEVPIKDSNIKIYPNPISNYININSGNEKLVSWEMYDMSGKSVLKGNTTPIDVQNIIKGNYLLKINLEKRQISKKIIIK
jgi:hypothetical protein